MLEKSPPPEADWPKALPPPPPNDDGAEVVGADEGFSAALAPKLNPLPEGVVLLPPPNRLDPPPDVAGVAAPPKLNPEPELAPALDVAAPPNRLVLVPEVAGVLPVLWPKRLWPVLFEGAAPKRDGDDVPLEDAGPPNVNLGGSGISVFGCVT